MRSSWIAEKSIIFTATGNGEEDIPVYLRGELNEAQ